MKCRACVNFIFIWLYITTLSSNHARSIYSISIIKHTNAENQRLIRYILIDSIGNVTQGAKGAAQRLNIQNLNEEITTYVERERLEKSPANNLVTFEEVPMPALNKQIIVVSIVFMDDVKKERLFRNKTQYSWGQTLDKDVTTYPIFKYLNNTEVKLINELLK